MKHSRFTDEHIIGILKSMENGLRTPMSAASTEYPKRPSLQLHLQFHHGRHRSIRPQYLGFKKTWMSRVLLQDRSRHPSETLPPLPPGALGNWPMTTVTRTTKYAPSRSACERPDVIRS